MLLKVSNPKKSPISVVVEVEGEEISIKVDTGAAVSDIDEATYLKAVKKSNPHLQPAERSLHTNTGGTLRYWDSYLLLSPMRVETKRT